MTQPLRLGSMCSGYGGLEMGVQEVLGGEVVWHVEFDAAPSRILAHHYPDVPNYGDVTATDWRTVPSIDVLLAGFPCQPFSHAGKRKGGNDERHLWPHIAHAIGILRPRLVVLENVRGLLSAQGDPDPEWVATLADQAARWQRLIDHTIAPKLRKARSRGEHDRITRLKEDRVRLTEQRRVALDTVRRARARLVRAIGVVARDLANLGYDLRWYGLRAADVGGAHGRFRVFLFATPADADDSGWGEHGRGVTVRAEQSAAERFGDSALTLLPTPAVNDMGAAYTPETWDAWTARMKADHDNGNGHGKSLAIEAQRLLRTPGAYDGMSGGSQHPCKVQAGGHAVGLRDQVEWELTGKPCPHCEAKLLPTPSVADTTGGRKSRSGDRSGELLLNGIAAAQEWGEYAAAIARAEHATGRTAPPPTEPGAKGNPRLSPAFVEWLMMLPAGHVTDPAIGLTRNEQLKALGNGVVPPQAAAATRAFIADTHAERGAA